MPKRPPELFLVDMLISIDRINRNAATLSLNEFVSDENIFAATMREFEIIGEAARNILRFPSIVKRSDIEWQKIVDFRNLIAHEYFGVIPSMVLEIIREDVPVLEKDLLSLIKNKRDKTQIIQAIDDTIEELVQMNRQESVNCLKDIKDKSN